MLTKFVNLQTPMVCRSVQSSRPQIISNSDRHSRKQVNPLPSTMRPSIHHQVPFHLRYRPSIYSSPPKRSIMPTINRASFSQKPDKPASDSPRNPSLKAVSFKDLGASCTVKVVVIVCLSIIGTMESITWGSLLWAKFTLSAEEGKREGEGGGK